MRLSNAKPTDDDIRKYWVGLSQMSRLPIILYGCCWTCAHTAMTCTKDSQCEEFAKIYPVLEND